MRAKDTSVLAPDSPQAKAIADLFYFDLMISVVIFATVAVMVVLALRRFRWRQGAPEPYQNPGNPKLEVIWTVVPTLILLALFIGTAHTMYVANPPVHGQKPMVVVIAHQWWWEYRYPASGVVTANELHLPADSTSLLELRSADVIHDFWVPDLGAKMDAIPGHPNTLWLGPRTPGTYFGTCAEYCGTQHALMGIQVMVDPPAAFATWEQQQLVVPATPTQGVAADGARLFQQRTCQNCHAIAGTKAQARVGPDLTHLASRNTLAAGVLSNTTPDLVRWLVNPQHTKPGCYMPNLHLTESEAQAIAAYLEEGKR